MALTVNRAELISYLDTYLASKLIKDYCPNGLQVEGSKKVTKIITGVTASQALIDEAISKQADMLLVHHGYFWKGEKEAIVGLKKNRIKALLLNDINLVAYHLPVDVHSEIGNNAQLGQLLQIENIAPLDGLSPTGIVMHGKLNTPLSAADLASQLASILARKPLVSNVRNKPIETVAWCTGGGQGYIDAAALEGIDAFVTGEVSEQTIHSSREHGIDFFAAGHHATERYGIKALGEHLTQQFDVDVEFIDIDNPA